MFVFLSRDVYWQISTKKYYLSLFFYFKKNNFEHWNITLRPGSEIK